MSKHGEWAQLVDERMSQVTNLEMIRSSRFSKNQCKAGLAPLTQIC